MKGIQIRATGTLRLEKEEVHIDGNKKSLGSCTLEKTKEIGELRIHKEPFYEWDELTPESLHKFLDNSASSVRLGRILLELYPQKDKLFENVPYDEDDVIYEVEDISVVGINREFIVQAANTTEEPLKTVYKYSRNKNSLIDNLQMDARGILWSELEGSSEIDASKYDES